MRLDAVPARERSALGDGIAMRRFQCVGDARPTVPAATRCRDRLRWAETVAGAGEFTSTASALARFDREFGPHIAAFAECCVLLFDGDACIGTATAWYPPGAVGVSGAAGRLHWVAVLPPYRRRGFGVALVREALGLMRDRGTPSAFLTTQTASCAAINLYAAHFGFVADCAAPDAEVARGWSLVAEELRSSGVACPWLTVPVFQ